MTFHLDLDVFSCVEKIVDRGKVAIVWFLCLSALEFRIRKFAFDICVIFLTIVL